METNINKLIVQSVAFAQNGHIPVKHTCEGENISPSLTISNIPEGTRSLALVVEDPDAPSGTFYHWLLWNIPPQNDIAEGSGPGVSGANSYGATGYRGPCPPSGTHRYYFKVYALDILLNLASGEDIQALTTEMRGHILASGELLGKYSKSKVKASL